ncbi:MAG: hypothetical protein K6C12_12345 [Oscillospiraceae bacterium]|nr:hypothetical protein [Oscillospiraceae bacterium]
MSKKYYSMLLSGTLSTIVVTVLLMSDSIIAGSVIGETAVAGITLVSPLYSLAVFFSSVFSLGIPIAYSEEMGKFRQKEADRVFGFGFLMSLATGVFLLLSILLFGEIYLKSSHQLPTVVEEARRYLSFMRFTMLCLPLNNLLSSAVYSDGDDTIPMVSSLVQCVGNLTASFLLSRTMGIRGISLASFVFTLIATAILFLHFLKKNNSLRLNLYFSFPLMKKVVRYSFIDASVYLFSAAFTTVLNTFVTLYFGGEYLVLVSVVLLCSEFQMLYDGIGEAITPILSVYLGEDCFPGIRKIYRLAEKTSVAEGIFVFAVLFFAAPHIPGLLGISDPEMVRIAAAGVRFISVSGPFVSLLSLTAAYALVVDRILLGMATIGLRDFLLPGLFSVLFGMLFGLKGFFFGVMFGLVLAWVGMMVFMRLRYGDDAPLLLRKLEENRETLLYDLTVEPYSVRRIRDEIGEALKSRSYDHSTVFRVELLFEELFMLINEKNGDRVIQGECTLLLGDSAIRMITRDTGIIFDPTDDDMAITNIGSHVLLSVAERISDQKRYLMTMSFNRTSFEIKARKEIPA